ncbi:MAG: hypothetical protein IJP48_06485 [Synergistaceae bacterium]|nr:hypothetical protein [Synergistaceae bacterium]
MPSFRLSKESIRKLNLRFKRFKRVRELIHRNITSYINDFMNFQGDSHERREYLERKYKRLAPHENYLLHDSKSQKILFHVQDIALLTGRDPSSISRTLAKINALDGWCVRLLALRSETKSGNNNKIFVYDSKIFDLIIDFREAKYLERFQLYGNSDYQEVLRYWEYLKQLDELKTQSKSLNRVIEDESEIFNAPELPLMSVRDVLKLIGSKLFTIKVDMIFAMTFGICFMFARKWPALIPVFAGVSFTSLISCMIMLRVRAGNANLISDIGALSTLLVVFWGINLTIKNAIYTPGGTFLTLKERTPLITLQAVRASGARPLAFHINAENQDTISEIFYKYDSQREYKSTGFTWSGTPILLLEPEKQSGMLNITLKYRDIDNNESEPLAFAFDLEREYFNASKNLILNEENFIMIKRAGEVIKIAAVVNDSVKAVVYGINTRKPNAIHEVGKIDSKYQLKNENILTSQNSSVEYISSYIIFRDNTSSDVRIKKNPPADDS